MKTEQQVTGNLIGRRIGILGGGITGLTAAFYLLRAGADVTVIEAQPQIGGLSTCFDFGPFIWDKFYHCILTSDRPLLQLIDDLELSPDLRWTKTKVGFFAGGSLHSMSSSLDFLRFPLLSLWQKCRLGAGILYASRIRSCEALEQELASDWLVRIFGKQNYEKMWAPLLKCKLGTCRDEASAAFMWATIARLYSTRDNNASRNECLGYVRGGYRTVTDRLLREIGKMGGQIITGHPIVRIVADDCLKCSTAVHLFEFDSVISTLPTPILRKIAPQLGNQFGDQLDHVQYMGIVCMALVLRRSLTPYYVTNLVDDVPFTGIIEMTNLVSRAETSDKHLVYLPKYTAPGDPFFSAPEGDIWRSFKQSLSRIVPDLKDDDIERRYLFRERFVQPVPVRNYSALVPSMITPVPGLILANTTQIINSTLNNNEMVKIARRAVNMLANVPSHSATAVRSDDTRVPSTSKL